jgi:Cu2+-exporting ATPase
MQPNKSANSDGYEGLVQQTQSGQNALSVLVAGVHCALCIQKIETALNAKPGVSSARLNFSTGRLNMVWDGRPDAANDFVQSVIDLGYQVNPYSPDAEKTASQKEDRFLLLCLGVAGFAAGNIMLLSIGLWTTDAATMGEATRTLLHWISALIAIPAILFAGRPFFQSALSALRQKQTNMDVPISLALVLALGMSLFETIHHGEHVYFDSAVMLMFFLLIGRYLDFRARRHAKSAATDLMQTLSGFATVIEKGRTRRVLISQLAENMQIIVGAGEKIPADGIVANGESSIDTSLVTGETLPRDIKPGQEVYAGTINQSAPLTITVTKAAENSLLADIIRLMEQAEQGQAKYVRLADRAAALYTPVVHILAIAAFVMWWGIMGAMWQDALLIAVTVLIITCPCALGLAVPVVQVLATGSLMKRGVLVKSGDALERLAKIDMALFDKTGTLTIGRPEMVGEYKEQDLKRAVSLAAHSKHPLSQALAAAYNGDMFEPASIKEHPGKGIEATIKKQNIKLGSRAWCGDKSAQESDALELWLAVDGKPATVFYFKDQLKSDAITAVDALKKSNIALAILSGDRQIIADNIAQKLDIDTVHAEQTPVQKHETLKTLKEQGHSILMVGDGLNDAPVLAAADISMAPGSAVDMAQNAADIIFMGENLSPVPFTHKIAKKTQSLVKQNFALAILYNCIAIPLAFSGLVTPMVAALAMSGSSLLVIASSYRLKLSA